MLPLLLQIQPLDVTLQLALLFEDPLRLWRARDVPKRTCLNMLRLTLGNLILEDVERRLHAAKRLRQSTAGHFHRLTVHVLLLAP